jgi:AraC-like DNA-binding protein
MLADPDRTVTGIAYRLGYSDVASFVRSFRARTGLTPTAFRAARRGRKPVQTVDRAL